jgi:AAA+ superfamily predicted ATPase
MLTGGRWWALVREPVLRRQVAATPSSFQLGLGQAPGSADDEGGLLPARCENVFVPPMIPPGDDAVITSLLRALSVEPDNLPLRLHLAELLVRAGRRTDAVGHIAQALAAEPESEAARALMAQALGESTWEVARGPLHATGGLAAAEARTPDREDSGTGGFDWTAAEQQVGDIVPPTFADEAGLAEPHVDAYTAERPRVRLADVGGMDMVKKRLNAAFLTPMRNQELRRLYGKSLRGGLLLYGPPGCGKTFIARALAGELGAHFLAVGISEVLDMYLGRSEQNLHDLFELARRKAPCVLFFDEIDALGQRRSQTRNATIRTTVNQLLLELDNVTGDNDGVFVLAASNQPWDVDAALRRPGRLDRTILVLPPDAPARRAILAYHLRDRPVAGIDLAELALRTDGYSGADLAHVCDTAAERALIDSADSGTVRMIGPEDMDAALAEVPSSTGPWFEAARGIALFANQVGVYDELADYLRNRRML